VNKSYAAPGNYTVTLTVTDNDGATASGTLNVTVDDQDAPPVAVPGPDRTGDRVHALTFDGSGSYDPDGSVVAWHWDFGDGNASDGATVNHTYASLGNFTATLTVTDDGGLGGNASVRVAVVNLPPVLSDVSVPARWQGLGAIAFSAEASDPDGPAPSLRWDFGDGATATGPRASHAYAAYGHYAVTVTATDADGAAVSSGASVWVYALPVPVLAGPGSTDRLTTNSFEGNSSFDPDGQVVAWSWDFGDGASAHGAEAAHRYGRLGTFPVTLTVTDDDGFTNATTALVTVRNLPPVARVHAYGLANVNESLPYDGTGSSDPDGTVVAWSWDFGDGATATGPSPGHTYSAPGNYTVTLVVTDNDGGFGRTSQAVQVVDWLRVAVVLDAPAYSALAPPTGHVEASFANGLPVPGAAVAMRFAYRVDPQSPLASPLPPAPLPAPSPLPWEPFAEETRNTTDDGGRSDFAGPSVVAGLPFLQVPTEGPVSEARADARVTWEGNVGTGGAAYATYLVAPGLA
jgi:PKD repeat protein